jgi:hypothetical protein
MSDAKEIVSVTYITRSHFGHLPPGSLVEFPPEEAQKHLDHGAIGVPTLEELEAVAVGTWRDTRACDLPVQGPYFGGPRTLEQVEAARATGTRST